MNINNEFLFYTDAIVIVKLGSITNYKYPFLCEPLLCLSEKRRKIIHKFTQEWNILSYKTALIGKKFLFPG